MSTVDAHTPGHLRARRRSAGTCQDEADVSVGHAEQAPAAEGRRPRDVPHAHRQVLAARRAAPERQGDLPGLLRQRRRHRLRHVSRRGALLASRRSTTSTGCSASSSRSPAASRRSSGSRPARWSTAAANEDPTPAVVRAETWLAIAGGARGIGYFPDWWEEDIRNEVRLVNREILALAPALLSPVAKVNWSTQSPSASARAATTARPTSSP